MSDQDELRTLLAHVRRRWTAPALLDAGGRAAVAASVPLLALALAAWAFRPAGAALVVLALAGLSLSAAALVLVAARTARRPGDRDLARLIEERAAPGGVAAEACDEDVLVSALDIVDAPERHAAAFAPLVVARALAVLRAVVPATIVPPHLLRRAALRAGAGGLVLAMSLALALPGLRRAGATIWVALFPGSVQIAVLTGDTRVAAGHPLRIAATVHGRGAAWLAVEPSLVVSAGGEERAVPMTRGGDAFVYAFESVDRSFRYKVTAGPAVSRAYTVTALSPPRVTRVDLRYDYPVFSGLPSRTVEDGGDIYAPAGTSIRLAIHTDKPLAAGLIELGPGSSLPLQRAGTMVAEARMVVAGDGAYRVHLTDEDGLSSAGETEYFIRVMDDRPPDVRILRPSSDQGITPLEEVTIEARADDDHGVARFDLVYTVAGRAPVTVPFPRASGMETAAAGVHLLAAEELGVRPGDVITVYARATDIGRGKRPTETKSDIFFLEVKPFGEEFAAAESQAMGGGAATQVDGLIAAQKEIISATWNLERRSAAGRSRSDLQAVGQAQAELKARVERMTARGRRRGASLEPRPPQQIARPPVAERQPAGDDPVAAAAAAMGRAVERLAAEQTTGAIPHQMEALQGLLKAQAEARQRESVQQSARGGQGGSSRSDRDLSALFDRELQRQQRTNYETPPQSSEKTSGSDRSAAADRVRELARRQEALARRQRELAADGTPPDEARRQLQRLLRDQEELRQEAAALEKELRGGHAGEMREALSQMRQAAGEMQGRNAGAAAARGDQAAASLRQAERGLRAGTSDARQRAAGELKLEAQQIAEAQRRIAAEASRVAQDGTDRRGAREPEATAAAARSQDARRRLAAEQDALAERVDALQRGAERAERDTPGEEGTRFREAARRIRDEQIGSRMRASAREMDGTAQAQAASTAAGRQGRASQQLSQALESVIDALGGSGERQLTRELDRMREMRERLQRLEQEVRDAEQQSGQPQPASGRPSARGPGQQPGAGGRGTGGPGDGSPDLQRARDNYEREVRRSLDALGRPQAQPRGGAGGTPEQHEFSRSSPGNEAFKQDFGSWESLRKEVALALEEQEAAVAAQLTRKAAADRLSAGGSDRVPEGYRPLVSSYFESIAKARK